MRWYVQHFKPRYTGWKMEHVKAVSIKNREEQGTDLYYFNEAVTQITCNVTAVK